jgi:hypothetical protein
VSERERERERAKGRKVEKETFFFSPQLFPIGTSGIDFLIFQRLFPLSRRLRAHDETMTERQRKWEEEEKKN